MGVKRNRHRLRKALVATAVAGLATGTAGVVSTVSEGGVAAADPVSATLNYTCMFPLIGAQPLVVDINSDMPTSIAAGEATGAFQIDAVATVNDGARNGLRIVGGATLEGTATADANLELVTGGLPVAVDLGLASTPIPAEAGTFPVAATGSTPSLTFQEGQVGPATISVGSLVLNLAPKDANGELTGLGEFQSECTLDEGQDGVLHTFEITSGDGGGEDDTEAPAAPGNVTVSDVAADSVSLAWDAATDNVGVTGYDVLDAGGAVVASATEAMTTVTGLEPETEYTFTVVAKDAAGNVSPASPPVTATTTADDGGGEEPIPFSYTLSGESFISAANGTVPLNGTIDAQFDLASGTYEADVALEPTTAEFTILGFLPSTADIVFEPTGPTTGSLVDGQLTATVPLDINLTSVTLFGLPIGGGPDCRTVEPATIELASPEGEAFDPLAGGTLTGTYTLPALEGCGAFNGLISPFVAGPNNTLNMTLTPVS